MLLLFNIVGAVIAVVIPILVVWYLVKRPLPKKR